MGIIRQLRGAIAATAVGLCSLVVSGSLQAGFIGDTVKGTLHVGPSPINYFSTTAPYTDPESKLVIDPGVEFVSNSLLTPLTIQATDIGNSELLVSILNPNLAAVFIPDITLLFESMDWQPGPIPISSVVHDGGMAPISLSFTANSIFIRLGDIFLLPGRSTYSHYTVSAIAVPEPSTYLTLSTLGFIALLALPRKRKQVDIQQDI